MSMKSGTNATVKLGTTTVANMANWSVTDARDVLKAPVFGETFSQVAGVGTRNVSGTINGYLDLDDTTGQILIKTAYENGEALTNFRLYVDATNYFTGTEVYITSYNVSAAQNEIIPVEFNFEVSDNWTEV